MFTRADKIATFISAFTIIGLTGIAVALMFLGAISITIHIPKVTALWIILGAGFISGLIGGIGVIRSINNYLPKK